MDTGLTAWGDESIRLSTSTPMYLVAATVVNGDETQAVERLSALKPSNAHKLHWRDMGLKTQQKSLRIISAMDLSTTLVAATPLNGRKQERARRKCLETLLVELESSGVTKLVLESRGTYADKKDIDFLFYLRRSGVVSGIDVAHAEGRAASFLCISDQILGAYGDIITDAKRARAWNESWQAISSKLMVIKVAL